MSSDETRVFIINFAEQHKDGIIQSQDLISYLQSIMKVRNSKIIASRELKFIDKTTSIEVTSKITDLKKKDMKQYVRRFLRNKSLKNYIRVTGNKVDGISMEYINPVDNDIEE